MKYTILGKSGLKVSVAGLGCGGHSRLGQATGKSERESIALVRGALDLGINILDTAEAYGTESIAGKAVEEIPRDQVVLSTKKLLPPSDHPDPCGEIKNSFEESLRHLRTDYVDIYHLHGVRPDQYHYARDTLAPILFKMREEGKIRCAGISEAFGPDPGHRMLQEALKEDYWDVVMVGFNLLNPSARNRVFCETLEKNIGVLVMFALRKALSQPARLRETVAELKRKGLVDPASCGSESPLAFVTQGSKATTIPEVAYRFCRHEPGVHVVLTGTGKAQHLKENVESFLKPPLAHADQRRLEKIFGKVDSITGG